jgi:prephenate dehydrogenase
VFKRHLFRKVAIIGTGLLGGSLALAIKKEGLAAQVSGACRQEASLKVARDRGILDEASTDLRKVLQNADLVVLAAPVVENLRLIKDKEFVKHIKRGAIVTDVGSVKNAIVEAAEKYLAPHVLFVGSHPMAGSEKSGPAHAREDLFKGTTCIMTPVQKTNRLAKDKVRQLWVSVGAQVKPMEPLQHDEAMAYVSHLPHIAAFGLIRAIPDTFLAYGAAGLKDTTRVAASSSKMWSDICLSNYRNVLKAIDENARSLAEIRKAVVDKDDQALAQFFNQAKIKRDHLDKLNG